MQTASTSTLKPIYPMLAKSGSLSGLTPEHDIEPKLDGIRCIAVCDNGHTRLFSRTHQDITARFPEIVIKPAARNCILDGEIMCIDASGEPNFQLVQTRANRITDIQKAAELNPAILMNFDIVFCNDTPVQNFSAIWRRDLLLSTLPRHQVIQRITRADLPSYINKGEGLVLKHTRAVYSPGQRTSAWLKVKWEQEIVCYVSGIIPGIGKRSKTFGALRIEDANGKDLGKVGTGFTDKILADISSNRVNLQLAAIKVRYNDVTNDGKLRFARFVGFA